MNGRITRIKRVILICLLAVVLSTNSALANYENYTYDSYGDEYLEPQAFTPTRRIGAIDIGIEQFSSPSDIFVADDGFVYIADSGNHRIVVLNPDYTLNRIIDGFAENGSEEKFNQPQGVFVTDDNRIYIADTDNHRVVVLDEAGKLISVIYAPPEMEQLSDYEFSPIRISVDRAGRIFIVSRNLNKGMLELDRTGRFVSFYGATTVKRNIIDLVWSKILTREQKDNDSHNLPTEYSANDIDSEGFVYGSISAKNETRVAIRRLNPNGSNVLRNNGAHDPIGDLVGAGSDKEESQFVDICVLENGIYSALDQVRGRVFTYDNDGNLLYVFGGKGQHNGQLQRPQALDHTSDGRYLVLDSVLNQFVEYSPTEYANTINKAVIHQYNREYEQAEQSWKQVLKLTTNSENAYIGMGKSLYRQGQYREAMRYFKLGNRRDLYGKAFQEYRRTLINKSFSKVATALAVFLVLAAAWKLFSRRYRIEIRRGGK